MNKSDLIDFVATQGDIASKAAAKRVVDALVEKMIESIASQDVLSVAGLGTFYVVARDEREGRNPQTGAALTIPAKNVPKFRSSSKLKAAVN